VPFSNLIYNFSSAQQELVFCIETKIGKLQLRKDKTSGLERAGPSKIMG
jgi:hypothetical protein